jgi:hypothetical protein
MESMVRSPSEWFHEAARCYIEHHQGCAWCGGSHRVFKRRRENVTEYSCRDCDFRACHDDATGRYRTEPGEANADEVFSTLFDDD